MLLDCTLVNNHIMKGMQEMNKEELYAIRWHMGMFEMTENGTSTKSAYRIAMEKSPLVSLLQCADMISANCLENTCVVK